MRRATGLGFLAPVLSAVMLAGCSSSNVSEEPGLHAVKADGKLQRLNGSLEWERETWPERENLPPGTRFVVRLPAAGSGSGATAAPKIALRKVGWIRSEIRAGSEIGPPQGRRWVAAEVPEFAVPVRVAHDDKPDVLTVVPQKGALEPGLYSLELESGGKQLQARFGVGWSSVDQTRYAGAHCLDRYIDQSVTRYRSCATQRVAMPIDGLQIRLVEPDRRVVDGAVSVVIKGTIANISQAVRAVPMLQGDLKDDQGRVVHRWEFASPVPELEPGGYVSFTTVADNVPSTATDITVSFQPYSRAAVQ